ncbi:MAG: hypothetical protein ACUVXA_19755 [Candidatus Jordarchaeum sp.]|uniref:hypothetical protein n=1 Tax=Candidatus Jordarchaeum sp. TaxID=2823881 RepID=UPI00404A90D6
MTDPLWPPSTQTMFHWQFDPYRSVFEEIYSQYPKKKEDEANLKLVQETNNLEELIDLIPRVKGHSLLKLENKLAEFCGRNIEGIKTIIQNFESSEDGFQKEVLLTVLGLIGKKEGFTTVERFNDK